MIVPALHEVVAGLASLFVRRVAIVTVVACAALGARAVAALIEADRLPPAVPAAAPPPAKAPPAPSPRPDAEVVVARNVFCSSCERTAATAAPGGLAVELIATGVGPDPRAVVRVLGTELVGAWRVGEQIPGVGTLDRVHYTSIEVIEPGGNRRTIRLLEAAGAPTPKVAGPPPPDGITKLDDTTYEVERRLVRDLVTGTVKPNGARGQPVLDANGQIKGLRLFGVRGDSIAAAVGLRTGDVLSTIDGEPIKQLDQLLDLYAKLDQVSSVELGGTRAGKPLRLVFRLR